MGGCEISLSVPPIERFYCITSVSLIERLYCIASVSLIERLYCIASVSPIERFYCIASVSLIERFHCIASVSLIERFYVLHTYSNQIQYIDFCMVHVVRALSSKHSIFNIDCVFNYVRTYICTVCVYSPRVHVWYKCT